MRVQILLLFLLLLPLLPFDPAHGIGADEALRLAVQENSAHTDLVRKKTRDEGNVEDETQTLISSLRGCLITLGEQPTFTLQPGTTPGVISVGFERDDAEAIKKVMDPFLSKPVTLKSLDDMAEQIEACLESRQKVIMTAFYPPQEITQGVVTLQVQPATVGQVQWRGQLAFGSTFVQQNFRAHKQETLTRDALNADLDWLNQNTLRQTQALLVQSKEPGQVDLILKVDAPKPWRVYSGIDNSLSDQLGDHRWFVGAQYGDLWKQDHRLTTQFTGSLDLESLRGVSLVYEIPLPWRHLLEFSLSLSSTNSALTSGTSLVDQSGEFQRYGLTYTIPLKRWKGWRQEWHASLMWRQQHFQLSTLAVGGIAERELDWHGIQLETGWMMEKQDRLGMTQGALKMRWNPGFDGLSSSDADYRASGAMDASAWILDLSLQRTLSLQRAGLLNAQLNAQWTHQSLLAADQFAPAINGRVRGFDEITGYGDQGAVLTLEWLFPWLKTAKLGSIRPLAFVDSALVYERATQSNFELLSSGIGLRWQSKNFTASCDLGAPLLAPEGTQTEPRLRFSILMRW